jgi:hypothetical protein
VVRAAVQEAALGVRILYAVLVNLAGVAFVVFGIVRSGERPQVLLYAFILTCVAQLFTIEALMHLNRAGSPGWQRVASRLTSPPEPGRESYPVTDESTGQATGLSGYLIVAAVFSFFGFMLANVNADRELDLDAETLASDIVWALFVTAVYWAQDLVSRSLVIDFAAPRRVNYGYNTKAVTVLALGVLTAGVMVVVRQELGRGASGWVVLGPLLAWRAAYDVSMGITLAKRARGVTDGGAG